MAQLESLAGAVRLRGVTTGDQDICLALAPRPEQKAFVASNAYSLAQAAGNPACVPMLILTAGKPVGFAMYALDAEDDNYWIYRFMIDGRFQGRGYGKAALALLVETIFQEPGCARILLDVKPENHVARRLYAQAGFVYAGFEIDGEEVMVLGAPEPSPVP